MEKEEVFPSVINLNVGGKIFITTLSTLTKDRQSMLSVMFSGRHEIATDVRGNYFIDRNGDDFQYILDYLRNEQDLPPVNRALNVYREAQYYQLEGLTKALESYSRVFSSQLLQKRREAMETENWRQETILKAQERCLNDLSSTSNVTLISGEDYDRLINCGRCSRGDHDPVIATIQSNQKEQYSKETFKRLLEKVNKIDCVVRNVNSNEMKPFMELLIDSLKDQDYQVIPMRHDIRCKNMQMIFGHGQLQCDFKMMYYTLVFTWT